MDEPVEPQEDDKGSQSAASHTEESDEDGTGNESDNYDLQEPGSIRRKACSSENTGGPVLGNQQQEMSAVDAKQLEPAW
eukprot:4169074-Karenia_brevis.AAC.1